jgi:ribokinase
MDLALFGLIVADVIAEPMEARGWPKPGGLRVINSIQLTTGGNVCNTGIALAKLGQSVAACGIVGDDVLGRAVLERMRAGGLNTDGVVTADGAQTSATIVAVHGGGERTFFHTPGVTPRLDAKLFRQCFPIFRQCSWLQVGYFGLLPTLTPDLPELLREFKQTSPGTRIALDTVNPPGPWEQLAQILPHVDLLAPSRAEAEILTGKKQPRAMARALREHLSAGTLLGIKLDEDGCLLDDAEHSVLAPAYKVKVVDTTGAGDTWFAGLLVALRKGMPLERAAKFANRVAADCCTALGASAGVQSYEETLARV